MISRYRVKEVDGKFIPQEWFFGWYGIDRSSDYLWANNDYQIEYCGYRTLEQARKRIQSYRKPKQNVKYHKE
jgi:hypothetical protein